MNQKWPPELETLDQLLGGELPLHVIRQLFPDEDAFEKRLYEMLSNGDGHSGC